MKGLDLVRMAIGNTLRNPVRTFLTSLAIVIGTFTLSLALAVSGGLNSYIDDTIASIGDPEALAVTRPAADSDTSSGIRPYDPASGSSGVGALSVATGDTELLSQTDLDLIESLDGVSSVTTVRFVNVDFVQLDAEGHTEQWSISVAPAFSGVRMPLAAGEQPNLESTEHEIVLPRDYVEVFGLDDAQALVGQSANLGVTDPLGNQLLITATIVGVSDPVLTVNTPTANVNPALAESIFSVMAAGLPAEQSQRWAMSSIEVAPTDEMSTGETIAHVQEQLVEHGYVGSTVDEMLGQFRAFFDAILLMLTVFAAITLLAGSLGIVNTLFMSVQERTREIGLLKALGLTSRQVFGLFSLEAIAIGVLSSIVGISIPAIASYPVNSWLADGPLVDLPGLNLVSFTPEIIGGVAIVILTIAFVAGTIPASRAAQKDPIESLRYE